MNLTLSNPGPNATTTLGARSTAVLKIVDNELSLAFSAPNYSVRENVASATITVELTGVNAAPVTVAWASSDGTATAGSRLRHPRNGHAALDDTASDRDADLRGGRDAHHREGRGRSPSPS